MKAIFCLERFTDTIRPSMKSHVICLFQFVEITTTFSCFEPMDLLKYFFYILDPHRTGLVEKNDVKHFVTTIWNCPLTSNIKEAFIYLDSLDDGDGCYTFKGINLYAKSPVVMCIVCQN